MRVRTSLRFRVTLSFALLAAVISTGLASVLYVLTIDMEERLIEEALSVELEDYMGRYALDPETAPPSSTKIRTYVFSSDGRSHVPDKLYDLAPGLYHVDLEGMGFYVESRIRDDTHFAVLFEDTQIRHREKQFLLFLAVGALAMILSSAALGWWLARRVVYPVSELARCVSELSPEATGMELGDGFANDEVGQLARDFDDYQKRLAEFVERERAFTGDVSHELRTPLTVIEGASEIMLSDADLGAANRKRVQRIAQAAREASEVTSALLMLAREEGGEAYAVSECDVEEVLQQVVQSYLRIRNKQSLLMELNVEERPVLDVEPALLRVVLGNLIRNAVAYTPQGGVKITLKNRGVTIEDTGIGMDDAALERVFDRYYRAGGKGGTGIGLSLVKRICQRYGWQITMASQVGTGTRVQLLFE